MKKKIVYIVIIVIASILLVKTFDFKQNKNHVSKNTETQEVLPKKNVYVKYREGGPIDVNNLAFEYLDTSKSSFVNGAWYDSVEDYMIIKLRDTYYHYCDLPDSIWNSFTRTSSFGTYYDVSIKGGYSCQYKDVPDYK